MIATPQDIVEFWTAAGPKAWFAKDEAFDAALRARFEPTHHAAARGELDNWIATREGALALLLLLDQIPRNIFRGSAHAFATDPKARAVARAAVERGWHREGAAELRQFFLLPFEHSEALADQDAGLALARDLGDPDAIKWHGVHRDIVVRFGRFPHRNAALARETTAEEQAFLDGGGFSG